MPQRLQRVLTGRRITIPEDFAKKFNIREGDIIIVEEDKNRLSVIPAEVQPKNL